MDSLKKMEKKINRVTIIKMVCMKILYNWKYKK